MVPPASSRRPAAPRIALALAFSAALHAGGWLALQGLELRLPEVDVELQFGSEVEFGTDAPLAVAALPEPAPAAPETPAASAPSVEPDPAEPPAAEPEPSEPSDDEPDPADAGVPPDAAKPDASVPDAGPPDALVQEAGPPDAAAPEAGVDAGRDAHAGPAAAPDAATPHAGTEAGTDGGSADAGVDAGSAEAGTSSEAGAGSPSHSPSPPPVARTSPELPPGAQIAVRVDFGRLRGSPLEPEVRALMAAIPEWQQALQGSGIDPVSDLEQVMVAHPGAVTPGGWPDPSRFAIAGQLLTARGGTVEAVATRMAERRGRPLTRRRVGGRKALRWWDDSGHERWAVPLGDGRFLLAARRDLRPLLGIAQRGARGAGGQQDPFASWIAPPPGALLSIEAEGLRRFARRGAERVPLRLLAVVVPEGERFAVRLRAAYADPQEAARALSFWEAARTAYARNVFVQLLGLAPLLQRLQLQQDEAELLGTLRLGRQEARRLLRQLRAMLPRRVSPRPAPTRKRPAPPPETKEGARPGGPTPSSMP